MTKFELYEEWFKQQPFYVNMRYSRGDALFLRDGDVYRELPVQIGFAMSNLKQLEIDRLSGDLAELIGVVRGSLEALEEPNSGEIGYSKTLLGIHAGEQG